MTKTGIGVETEPQVVGKCDCGREIDTELTVGKSVVASRRSYPVRCAGCGSITRAYRIQHSGSKDSRRVSMPGLVQPDFMTDEPDCRFSGVDE
jgi:hypothetical protein